MMAGFVPKWARKLTREQLDSAPDMLPIGYAEECEMSEPNELTDEYRQHLLDLCERTDTSNDFATWKLATEAKTAIPLLIAELRRYKAAYNAVSDQYETSLNQLGATDA